MGIEIERKFLVRSPSWQRDVGQTFDIRQGHLALTELSSTRVRIIDCQSATLTVKSIKEGRRREEYEYPIPVWDAERLISWCRGSYVEKVRHEVVFDGMTWEVDVFSGENDGLVIAEVELDHVDQTFECPHWVGREVTDDRRYSNASLAMHPFGDWTFDCAPANIV